MRSSSSRWLASAAAGAALMAAAVSGMPLASAAALGNSNSNTLVASAVTPLDDDGPSDDGPSDDGPSDDGPSDDGPSDDGPSDDPDSDSDGLVDSVDVDDDGDGILDARDRDSNGDGVRETTRQVDADPSLPEVIRIGKPFAVGGEGTDQTDEGMAVSYSVTCKALKSHGRKTVRAKKLCDISSSSPSSTVRVTALAPAKITIVATAAATGEFKAFRKTSVYRAR